MEIFITLTLVFILITIDKLYSYRFSRLESRVKELEETIRFLNQKN